MNEFDRSGIVIFNLGNSFKFTSDGDKDLVNTLEDVKDGYFSLALQPCGTFKLKLRPYVILWANQFPPEDLVKGLSTDKWDFRFIDQLYCQLVPYTGFEELLRETEKQRYRENMALRRGELERSTAQDQEANTILQCFKPVQGTRRRKTKDLLVIAKNKANFQGDAVDLGRVIARVFRDYTFVKRGPSNGAAGWDGLADV